MPRLDAEQLHRIQQKVLEQRERTARQREAVEVCRRELWERMDRLRECGILPGPHAHAWFALPPRASILAEGTVSAGWPDDVVPAGCGACNDQPIVTCFDPELAGSD